MAVFNVLFVQLQQAHEKLAAQESPMAEIVDKLGSLLYEMVYPESVEE